MKKIFTLIMALMAIATGAWAETVNYGFSVRGYEITSDNLEQRSKNAPWSYDTAANVLFLNEGIIHENNSDPLRINGNVNPTLKVCVTGNCRIEGKFDVGIRFVGNGTHTIFGSGTLSIESQVVNPQLIVANSGSCNLTIKDITLNLTAYGDGSVGFNNSQFSAVTLDHCEMNITTQGYAFASFDGAHVEPTLINCYLENGYVSSSFYTFDEGGNAVHLKEAYVKRAEAIDEVNLTVTEPVAGNTISTECTVVGEGYEVSHEIEWYDVETNKFLNEGDQFVEGRYYSVIIGLKATDRGHRFPENKNEMIAYVNGKRATVLRTNNEYAAIRYAFGWEGPYPEYEEYNLTIDAKQVTSRNASDILGNGVFAYNAGTKILSIKGDYTCEYPMINSHIDGLTINVEQDATLECKNMVIYLEESATITGEGKLSLKSTHNIAVYVEKGKTLNINSANIDINGVNGIFGAYNDEPKLIIKASDVTINTTTSGSSTAIWGFSGGITFEDCAITSPEGAYVSDGIVVDKDGNNAKNVIIKSTIAKRYDLWVGVTQVDEANKDNILGDGSLKFDSATKTLHILKNCNLGDSYIKSSIKGLVVRCDATATLKADKWALYLTTDATLTGNGHLTIDCANVAITASSGNLLVKDVELTATGCQYGFYGFTSVTFNNAKVSASCTTAAFQNIFSDVHLNDCYVQTPVGYSFYNGQILDQNGNDVKNLSIVRGAGHEYDLTVAYTRVTTRNQDDVLGNGVFRYDDATNTLTVSGSYTGATRHVVQNKIDGLTIRLVGDIELSSNISTFSLQKDTRITSTGQAKITSENDCAIYCPGDVVLRIEYADLDVSGVWGINGNAHYLGRLVVKNSSMTINSDEYAVCDFLSGIKLTGCYIAQPVGGWVNGGAIVDMGGNIAHQVVIQSTSTATAIEPASVVYDTAQPRPLYNLQGQRVGEGYRGIVIKNGRKVLVK